MVMKRDDLIEFFEKKRDDFPILKQDVNGHKLVYVDNGATTQKPQVVIDSIVDFYCNYNSNVHRGVHTLSEMATEKYEEVREKVARFINCSSDEVVFTKGTTESLNLAAFGLEDFVCEGDEIVLSEFEHHSDLVPWQELAKKKGAKLRFIPFDDDFRLDLDEARKLIGERTKIVSVAHVSNVLGSVSPVKELGEIAHSVGAVFVVDGAQSVPHMKIDVCDLGCDLLAFSSHKMCGPTGVGVLYGKRDLFEKMKPSQFGGDMIYEVGFDESSFNKVPYKFEAGTPDIEGVIAFGVAIDYLMEIGMENVEAYEKVLVSHFLKRVCEVDGLTLFGSCGCENRSSVFSFNLEGVHAHDMSAILDKWGIAIRGGHHCAMPLASVLGVCATSRVSLYFYNTVAEIDYVVDCLKKVKREFEKGEFLL